MAAGFPQDQSFEVNVKDFQGSSVVIKVQPEWNVGMVKQEIARRTNFNPQEFRIVFAGQTLDDGARLWDIGVQGYSTLHCIRFRGVEVRMDRNLHQAAGNLGAMPTSMRSMSEPGESSTSARPVHHRFYVYCKSPCNAMRPGKLRVRCADCKDTSFVLLGGPSGWEDVLTPRKLNGQCHRQGCNGTFAEFYFKCANHRTEENEECVALHMIRANTVKVECASCLEVTELVVVFDCEQGHCMCVDCFKQYCETKLTSRQFIQRSPIGYTLLCPNHCAGSEVREMHHFRMLGKDLYDRYQKFGTEEFILECGGVLCPNTDCGQGLFPEDDGRRIQCPRIIGGCGYVFCRNCKSAYHEGPCQRVQQTAAQAPSQQNGQAQPNPANVQRAGWIEANERFIHDNTKPCPRCKAPIEKSGGCMHMTCIIPRCRFEWCWICEVEWNGQCQATHWFG